MALIRPRGRLLSIVSKTKLHKCSNFEKFLRFRLFYNEGFARRSIFDIINQVLYDWSFKLKKKNCPPTPWPAAGRVQTQKTDNYRTKVNKVA